MKFGIVELKGSLDQQKLAEEVNEWVMKHGESVTIKQVQPYVNASNRQCILIGCEEDHMQEAMEAIVQRAVAGASPMELLQVCENIPLPTVVEAIQRLNDAHILDFSFGCYRVVGTPIPTGGDENDHH